MTFKLIKYEKIKDVKYGGKKHCTDILFFILTVPIKNLFLIDRHEEFHHIRRVSSKSLDLSSGCVASFVRLLEIISVRDSLAPASSRTRTSL